MPGLSSGLSPHVVVHGPIDDPSLQDRTFSEICKWPLAYTLVDMFVISELALTTENSTTHMRTVFQDGGTTGDGTTAIGVINGPTVAYTGRTRGTNYAHVANEWTRVSFSEAGTVNVGLTTAVVWGVAGTV